LTVRHVKSDLQIAQEAKLKPIAEIAGSLAIPLEFLESYGPYKAKVSLEFLSNLGTRRGKLILVSAMSPTPAGEGKTTTTVGLGDALNRIGKKTAICLREPSLGPVMGLKGGAAGGGFAQIVPMADINLHFTGDFHAIALAHNLLSALIDNHIYHGNDLGIDINNITWRRVMDMNDRALREITVGIGGKTSDTQRNDGFDIVVASEVMAIFCLATSVRDLKQRLARIVIGYTVTGLPVRAQDLRAEGAMTVLLREALKPNLVQTLENNPAFIHGGPFANIAHGCNSVLATTSALQLADYVVTEAGFGADLGGEKFVDIKCRKAGLTPAAIVVVATIRALKYHGGCDLKSLSTENLPAIEMGLSNLERHVRNVQTHYGLPCVVSVNHFTDDTPAEFALVKQRLSHLNVPVVSARHWAEGSAGAEELARTVVEVAETGINRFRYVYDDAAPLLEKLRRVAVDIYGAADISANAEVRQKIQQFEAAGYGHYPVCIAKTQYSFSTDPRLRGAPSGHVVDVRDVRLAAGAEFIIFLCGDVLTMPGLPKSPAAERIDIDDDGRVIGLF
jgi:formate--tetrahydrofolate ligase